MVMRTDMAQKQEWLCWRGAVAIYCTGIIGLYEILGFFVGYETELWRNVLPPSSGRAEDVCNCEYERGSDINISLFSEK
jgi:hypothetical protein